MAMRSRGTRAASRSSSTVRDLRCPPGHQGCFASDVLGLIEDLDSAAAGFDEVEDADGLFAGQTGAAGFRRLAGARRSRAVATDFRQLVESHRSTEAGSAGKLQRLEEAVEDLAVIERDREVGHSGRGECVVDHLGRFGVGQDALGADGVEIALNEFAKPALGRALAAKDRPDRVALERECRARRCAWRRIGPGERSGRSAGPARRACRPCW